MNSLPTQWTDCMTDLETSGRMPDRHAIIQIGAVRFNLEHMTIDGANVFDRCLLIPPWRGWEESTREWWGQQKASVLDEILARAEDPKVVIRDFFDWANIHPNMRFWAKPTSFDFTFVASAFADAGLPNPFHYRVARDVNSWVEARYYPEPVPEVERSDLGDAHNAYNDCLYQIEHVFNHYKGTRK